MLETICPYVRPKAVSLKSWAQDTQDSLSAYLVDESQDVEKRRGRWCSGWGVVVNSRLLMSITTAINTVGRRGKQRLDVDFDLIAVSQSCNQTRSEIAKLEQTEYKFLLTSTSMNGSLGCHPCRNVFFPPLVTIQNSSAGRDNFLILHTWND